MRTPLGKVRGLGSAKEGADHFWMQRVTAVANIFLVIFLVWLVVSLVGKDYASARAAFASPFVSIPMLLLVISGMVHMRLGLQTVVEDYVQAEGKKVALLMLNTFFVIVIGMVCVFAVMKMSFGA